MNKIGIRLLICIYIFMVLSLTLYLFTYSMASESKVSPNMLFVAKDLCNISNGSLVITKRNIEKIEINNKIFYYDVYHGNNNVLCDEVKGLEKTNEKEITFEIREKRYLSSSYVLGTVESSFSIPLLGYLFSLLTSPAGYLLFALLPTLLLFIYQLNILVKKYLK